MTNYIITLSSNSTDIITITPQHLLQDVTTLSIKFDGIDESSMPLYMNIDWGDDMIESFDNNILPKGLDRINNFNINPLFSETYSHLYRPSNNTLYKNLSAQILIKYSDSNESWFIIPIKIRSYDYFESIYDLTLLNCNILPSENNDKQYQFITHKDNYLIELRGS